MNVYDFDKTIYEHDSTLDFYLYCLKKHKKVILHIPSLFFSFIRFYVFKSGTKTRFKEKMYSFLKECDTENDVRLFWKKNKKYIKKWYQNQKNDTDIIISASPVFLLKPICDELGVRLIASNVSPADGKTDGENCYHDEKVRRLKKEYGDVSIDEFYSDSYSDTPLAKISKKAFIVKGDELIPWNFDEQYKVRK